MYGAIKDLDSDKGFRVFGTVLVIALPENKVDLEWDSDPITDMIADSIVAVILQASSSPASVKGIDFII
jgi:cleavage and polyadenylation specificity factor subunit 3